MAGFEYLIQGQGPTVPISLFSEAATAGINAGNALPTGLTAGIQGAIRGYQQGQQIEASNQVADLRSLEIQRQQTLQQIDQMKLQAAELTKDTNLQIAAQEAKNQLKEVQQQAADLQNQTRLVDTLNGATPGDALHDPSLSQYLLRNKEARDYAHNSILNNPNASPEDKQMAAGLADYWKQQEVRLREEQLNIQAKKAALKNDSSVVNAYNDPSINPIAQEFGLRADQLNQIKLYPKGLKNFDEKGNPIEGPDNTQLASTADFDVVVNGKKSNSVINSSVKKILSDAQTHLGALNEVAQAPTKQVVKEVPAPPSLTQRFSNAVTQGAQTAVSGLAAQVPHEETPIMNSTDPITNQAARRLIDKLKMSADPRDRVRLKSISKPIESTYQYPDGFNPDAYNPNEAIVGNQGDVTQPVQQAATPPVELTKQNISEIHKTLPQSTQAFTSPETIFKVAKNPYTANLDSLQKAVVAVESGGNAKAKAGTTSATGFFQLTNAAAKDTKVDKNNPSENIKGGITYLNKMLGNYNGSPVPALLAYHLGNAPVEAAVQLAESYDYEAIMANLQRFIKVGRDFRGALTPSTFKTAKEYPFKVLAYKDAFERLSNG